jgi:hypothetical protein
MAPRAAALLAAELDRDAPWQTAQVEFFHETAAKYTLDAV